MKVLVYGAGVIGCYLTHILCEAGNDVTLLARGSWKQNLETNGLVIRHSLQRKTTTDHPRITDSHSLESYDVVFAVMQHQQMWEIQDDLASVNSPVVVLVGNNMSASRMEEYIREHTKLPKTVLFGFQGTGGRREDGKVICVRAGAGSMSIGGVHSEQPDGIRATLAQLFAGTKYKLSWMPDMDAWYKCHAAFILPVAFLCYTVDCNLRRSTHAQRRCLLNAAQEAYALLAGLGYPILPPGEETYFRPGIRRALMSAVLFVMAKTVIGDLAASDHCRHAVTEMEGLDRAWEGLRKEMPDFPMPNWDACHAAMPDWEILHRRR